MKMIRFCQNELVIDLLMLEIQHCNESFLPLCADSRFFS